VVVYSTISVSWLWNLIMESTYNRNEPGVLFLDRANYFAPLNYAETILATNPCGEQTLAPGGVCCLGTLNLTQFVNHEVGGFDLDRIRTYTGYLVRFLDNVNAVSDAPLEAYKHSMSEKRRIGCGIMGWGSALFMLQVRFGSEEAAKLRDQVMSTMAQAAYEASIDLAVEKGKFTYCDPEKHAATPFVQNLGLSEEYMTKLRTTGIRNSSLLSQQPNGNTSIEANIVSGGIEPIFMPEYIRTKIETFPPAHIADVTPKYHEGVFEETSMFKWVKEGDEDILRGVDSMGVVYKIDRNRGLTREVLCEDYGVRYLKSVGKWDPKADWAVTTTELSAQDHVADLAGFARWTDSACSKTCNIPHDYPFEDFKNLYLDAYNTGVIKGFTTYRAGTMTSVLSAKDESTATNDDEEIILEDIKLPDSLPATLKTLKAEGKKYYLTVILNEAQTRPVALFAHTNHHEKTVTTSDAVERLIDMARTKGIPESHIESAMSKMAGDTNTTRICRVISLCLRHGVLVKNVVHTLEQVDCVVGSFVFQVRKFLSLLIKDGEKVQGITCSECGSEHMVYQEGCQICKNCGAGRC
jgi:ribonucleoside-diphosphate reductase alpha chain